MNYQVDPTVDNYPTVFSVIEETRDLFVLDLSTLGLQINPYYDGCYLPSNGMVWVKGRIKPLLTTGKKYYSASALKANAPADITSFEAFVGCTELVYTEAKTPVVRFPPAMNKAAFMKRCPYDERTIWNAVVVVLGMLERLHPMTYVTMGKGLSSFSALSFVKGEHFTQQEGVIEYNEEDHPGIGQLMQEIYKFVGRDTANLYHVDLDNTTLRISKGHDYRVVAYYENLINQRQEEEAA